MSLQWVNNTDSLPSVIWPFHLLWINQTWLDSPHKFQWRVMTLTWFLHYGGVLWLDGLRNHSCWLSIWGKVLRFCDKLSLWRSAPMRRLLINHTTDICTQWTAQSLSLYTLISDNDSDAKERLWPGRLCRRGQTLWEGRPIVVISEWMTTKISH